MDVVNFVLYSGNIAVNVAIAVAVLCGGIVILSLVVIIAVYVGKSLAYHNSLN